MSTWAPGRSPRPCAEAAIRPRSAPPSSLAVAAGSDDNISPPYGGLVACVERGA